MKRHFYILCALVCALAWPMIAQAQKVVYLDMQYILRNLPQYETANEQLSMISKRWQKEVDALTAEAELLETNYQTEQIFLSPELKRKYFGKDGELFKKREALLKPIQDEIYQAVQDICGEKKYDVVKDRSADPALIYMSSKLDISDLVLEKLGAK